jgi:hypothetical protein
VAVASAMKGSRSEVVGPSPAIEVQTASRRPRRTARESPKRSPSPGGKRDAELAKTANELLPPVAVSSSLHRRGWLLHGDGAATLGPDAVSYATVTRWLRDVAFVSAVEQPT